MNRFSVQESLYNDEIDIAIMGVIEDDGKFDVERFVPNELVVVANPFHRLAHGTNIPFSEFAKERLLLRPPGSGTRTDVERMLSWRDAPLNLGMELPNLQAIKDAVASGLGISVVCLGSLELELLTQRLITLDIEFFPVHRYWYLVRRSDRRLPKAVMNVWAFLIEYSAEDTETLTNAIQSQSSDDT